MSPVATAATVQGCWERSIGGTRGYRENRTGTGDCFVIGPAVINNNYWDLVEA
jgi:hypothetical protein